MSDESELAAAIALSLAPVAMVAPAAPVAMAAPAASSWRLVDSTGSGLDVDNGLVLGREQLGPESEDNSFVSRKQAVLAFDGAQLYLTSHGQNPTGLLLAGSTEWRRV